MSDPALRTPGTRGFLLWVKSHLPWVYAEYVRRGAAAIINPGVGADYGDGYMGALDVTADVGGTTTYFGDDTPPEPTAPSTTDPAATAPTSATPPDQASWLTKIAQAAGTFYLAKQQAQTQSKLVDLQLQRAQAGLPMLDLSRLEQGLPQPQVNVGLSANTQRMVMIGGAALLGVVLLMSVMNRPRRSA